MQEWKERIVLSHCIFNAFVISKAAEDSIVDCFHNLTMDSVVPMVHLRKHQGRVLKSCDLPRVTKCIFKNEVLADFTD